MKLSISLFTASAVMFAAPSFAQELLPNLNLTEIPDGMPADSRLSAGLFALGDTAADVQRKIASLDRKVYRTTHTDAHRRQLRQGNVTVDYKYGRSRTTIRTKQAVETVDISYASALFGNRVQTISRALRFKDEVSVADLRKSVFDKYGAPSIEHTWGSSVDMRYVFKGGKLLRASELASIKDQNEACRYTINEVPINRPKQYKFQQERVVKYASCNGEILVQYSLGTRADLARSLSVRMWDYGLAANDLIAQDQFLINTLNNRVASKTGSAAPKL